MISNIFNITELTQTIVTYAKRYGVLLLSTCKYLYNIKPNIKLNVHAIINSAICDAYKNYDFKNINYVYFGNINSHPFMKLELQVPVIYGSHITLDDVGLMDGKLYTKFIFITVTNEDSKKQLFDMLDSRKYKHVFVNLGTLPMKLNKPDFVTTIVGNNEQIMCFDVHHKQLIMGVKGNEFGKMMILHEHRIIGDDPICPDNMCFNRNVSSSNELRNLMKSGKQTDILITSSAILNQATYIVTSICIYTTLETDRLYIGNNILCKKIMLTICSHNPFSEVILDNDCEYSFSAQVKFPDRYPLRFFSDGVNLLVHSNNNTVVLVNSLKYVPTKYRLISSCDINYINSAITKDNYRKIISKYLYNDQHMIISKRKYGTVNYDRIYAYDWCGDTIKVCDIEAFVYKLILNNDNTEKQLTVMDISNSNIRIQFHIIIKCTNFCDEVTLVINLNRAHVSNIPHLIVECIDANKLTVNFCGNEQILYRQSIDHNITTKCSIICNTIMHPKYDHPMTD